MAMMNILDDAENGRSHDRAPVTLSQCDSLEVLPRPDQQAAAQGHSIHYGPPFLRCSVPWGVMMLNEVNPTHSYVDEKRADWDALMSRSILTVRVDWGNLTPSDFPGPVKLVLRRAGIEIYSAVRSALATLEHSFSVEHAFSGVKRRFHVVS